MATEQQEKRTETQEAPTRPFVFNKDTGIVGYTFADGRKFRQGPTYFLTDEEKKAYADKNVNGRQLLVLKK